MMPMGFETGQRRKLDVVHTRPEDMEAPLFDLGPFIRAANQTKQSIPALNEEGPQRRIQLQDSSIVGLLKTTIDESSRCLGLINPDWDSVHHVNVSAIEKQVGSGWQIVCDSNLGAVEGPFESSATLKFHPLAMRILRRS
jgi:starch synthase (maltosyl-transferring)